MESRFGPFTHAREPIAEIARSAPWADTVRPTILAAVDSAKTWGDLSQRLDRDGIVIKLIQRGARVQGLVLQRAAIPKRQAAARRGSTRAARKPHSSSVLARVRIHRSSHPSAAAARRRSRRTRSHAAIRDGRCATPNASPTMPGCAQSTERVASVSSANVPRQWVRAGMRRGSASERNGSVMPRSATKRACSCAQWRGWARAASSPVSSHTGRVDAATGRRRAREHDAARVRWEATKIRGSRRSGG